MKCDNVSSTNFMAYRIPDKAKFIDWANKAGINTTVELNASMQKAKEALKDTVYTIVDTFVSGEKLLHGIQIKKPFLGKEGKVAYTWDNARNYEKLDDAVKEALELEKTYTAIDAYKKEQASLLEELAPKTNK